MEIIIPKDEQEWLELRLKDVTSTEVSALFGISPYTTAFELWHRKKDAVVVRLDENERMFWGTRLQDAIASSIAEKEGWTIRRMNEYMRDPDTRMGSSYDFSIENISQVTIGDPLNFGSGILEIKNVDGIVFKTEWLEKPDGTFEAPLHIEIQVQQELYCSGRQFCYIGVLVGGNRLVLIKRTRDEAVISTIKQKVSEFWTSIEENNPPPPNFETDAEFIRELFGYAEPGKVLNVVEDAEMLKQAQEYKRLGDIQKDAESKHDAIKAWFLTNIGDAEKCVGLGFSIDAGVTGAAHVEFDRAAFRRFKINWKKEKKA